MNNLAIPLLDEKTPDSVPRKQPRTATLQPAAIRPTVALPQSQPSVPPLGELTGECTMMAGLIMSAPRNCASSAKGRFIGGYVFSDGTRGRLYCYADGRQYKLPTLG